MLYFDLTGPLVFDMIGRCKSQIVARLDKRKPRGRWKKLRKQWQKVRWSKMQRGTHRRGILRYVEWVREGVGWNGLECKVTLWATLFKMNRQLHFWGGVAGGNRAQHTHPFACNQKTHVELLRHVTVCLHHHFGWWLTSKIDLGWSALEIAGPWSIYDWIQSSNANGFCATKSPAWLQKLLKEAFFL